MLKTLTITAATVMIFAAPLTSSAVETVQAESREPLVLQEGCASEAPLSLRQQSPRITTASVISPPGGCGWPEHLECLDLCAQAADACYNSCTTPLCRFQCIQQARDCEFACDYFYCGL